LGFGARVKRELQGVIYSANLVAQKWGNDKICSSAILVIGKISFLIFYFKWKQKFLRKCVNIDALIALSTKVSVFEIYKFVIKLVGLNKLGSPKIIQFNEISLLT